MPTLGHFAFVLVLAPMLRAASVFFMDDEMQTVTYPIERESVRHLESDILDVLGIPEPPEYVNKGANAIADFMRSLYQHISDERQSDVPSSRRPSIPGIASADMVMSIVPKDTIIMSDNLLKLRFVLKDLPKNAELSSAYLKFLLPENSNIYKIAVFEESAESLVPLSSWNILDGSDVLFNITEKVQRWLSDSTLPELLVSVQSKDGDPVRSDDWQVFGIVAFSSVSPQVFDRKTRKSKRDLAERRGRKPAPPMQSTPYKHPFRSGFHHQKPSCRRHGMYVDFKDMGWEEWVIAPPGYHANYCDGACTFPLVPKMNATNHAIVQTLLHHTFRRHAAAARCAPLTLTSMQVLFKADKDNYMLKTFNNMVVQDCGCQ